MLRHIVKLNVPDQKCVRHPQQNISVGHVQIYASNVRCISKGNCNITLTF